MLVAMGYVLPYKARYSWQGRGKDRGDGETRKKT